MPCTIPDLGVSGVKLVSVFPDNPRRGLPNVSGSILLLNTEDGAPSAVLDAGFVTALRTALVGGLAAKYLAPEAPREIALLGAGEQAFMHLLVFSTLFPTLRICRIASRRSQSERKLAERIWGRISRMRIACEGGDYASAVKGADVIVTAISGQEPVLHADWVKEGSFYCHVGGVEDEYAVAQKADKIVCDSWDALKHRGSPTLSHMYRDGVLGDDDIYAELADLVMGRKAGRESAGEFNYFNSIGLAFTDLYIAVALRDQCLRRGMGVRLPADVCDVFENEGLRRALGENGRRRGASNASF